MVNRICFPEPVAVDDTWATYRESTVDWLQRSTRPRAQKVRRFLNENIARLPETVQASFFHAIRSRWHSGLSELVVARTIQLLGGVFCVEESNSEGRRPDFKATFGKQDVVILKWCQVLTFDTSLSTSFAKSLSLDNSFSSLAAALLTAL